MRLLVAVVFSALIHMGIMWSLLQLEDQHQPKPQIQSQALNVFILPTKPVQRKPQNLVDKNLLLSGMILNEEITPVNVKKNQQVLENIPLNQQYNVQTPVADDSTAHFYATSDLERKALPISNIDTEMLGDVVITGIPLRLRIYIDANGRVKKIEELAILEQDRELANKLESLLMETAFLAAKKDGLDVNSYQDIEFNFLQGLDKLPLANKPANITTPTSGAENSHDALSR